jgi:DNA-binding transcriptional LysR family regulator
MHFDLDTLKLFTYVIEEGSIQGGSLRQHIAPSAASRRMNDLENDVGMPLLQRHSRGIQATVVGQVLYTHAKLVLSQLQRAEEELNDHRDGAIGSARLSVTMTAMVHYLPSDLSRFLKTYPGIQVDLNEETTDLVVRAVQDGTADLGICAPASPVSGVIEAPYRIDRLTLIVPSAHRFAGLGEVRFADTLGEDYVGMQAGSSIHTLMEQEAKALGERLKLRIQVTSFEAIRNMVGAGVGIGILPEIALETTPQSAYVQVRLAEPWCDRPLKILRSAEHPLSPAAKLLVAALTSER